MKKIILFSTLLIALGSLIHHLNAPKKNEEIIKKTEQIEEVNTKAKIQRKECQNLM